MKALRDVAMTLTVTALALGLLACSSSAPQQPAATTPQPAEQPAATTPQPVEEPAEAATSETLSPEPMPAMTAMPPEDKVWITVYRKKRFVGSALNTSVFVDGVEVADLDPGTYVRVEIDPGTHVLHGDEKKDSIELDTEAGQHYFFRVELQAGLWKGHGVLLKVPVSEGAAQFKEWKLKLAKDIRTPGMVVRDPSKG